jgi:hypothetical protein
MAKHPSNAAQVHENQYIGIGIAVGAGVGMTVGVLIGGWAIAVGLCLGAGVGVAIGAAMDERRRRKTPHS